MMTDNREAGSATSGRSFELNSEEAYGALCQRIEQPWIPNGALPREARVRDQPVIVEARRR